jgi:hypothetical protein
MMAPTNQDRLHRGCARLPVGPLDRLLLIGEIFPESILPAGAAIDSMMWASWRMYCNVVMRASAGMVATPSSRRISVVGGFQIDVDRKRHC